MRLSPLQRGSLVFIYYYCLLSKCLSDRLDCREGFFGEVCEHTCSEQCKTIGCDINNGSCECEVGYAGNPCTKCPENCDATGCNDDFHCYTCKPGFYGDFCNKTCSKHCVDNKCNRDGRCNCTVGYGGHPCEACPKNCSDAGCNEHLICHECDPGFYGDYCNLTCSINCINGTCNRNGSCTCKKGFTGLGCCPVNCKGDCNDTNFVCLSCMDGYHGDFCNKTCPDNCTSGCSRDGKKCKSCELRHWGPLCEKDCPEQCSSQCDQNKGTCPCNPGFVGRQCQRKNCFSSIACSKYMTKVNSSIKYYSLLLQYLCK